MKKKITQEEWFAAASAHDLWGAYYLNPMLFGGLVKNVNGTCEASIVIYSLLLDEAEIDGDLADLSFLAAQIGCEKAGL